MNIIPHQSVAIPLDSTQPAPTPAVANSSAALSRLPVYHAPLHIVKDLVTLAIAAPCGAIVAKKDAKTKPHTFANLHGARQALAWLNNPECHIVRLVAQDKTTTTSSRAMMERLQMNLAPVPVATKKEP